MISGRRLTVLAACLPMLLGACSDDSADGNDSSTPDRTPSASESATESPSGSPSPSGSDSPTKEYPEDRSAKKISAERVARIWAREYGKAIQSGSTRRMRSMGLDSCLQCADYADQIDEIYAAGGRMETSGVARKMGDVEILDMPTKRQIVLKFPVHAAGGTTVPESGDEPIKYQNQEFEWIFEMKVASGKWRIHSLGVAG